MTMIGTSELRLHCVATAADVKVLRRALTAFLDVFGLEKSFLEDVNLAVGEVLANAVEHSNPSGTSADLEIFARAGDAHSLAIDVCDRGTFLVRERQTGRGFGLGIVRSIARDVTIETEGGTRVSMVFDGG